MSSNRILLGAAVACTLGMGAALAQTAAPTAAPAPVAAPAAAAATPTAPATAAGPAAAAATKPPAAITAPAAKKAPAAAAAPAATTTAAAASGVTSVAPKAAAGKKERCMRLPLSDVAFGKEASIAAARVKLDEYAAAEAKRRGWAQTPLVKSAETLGGCELYLDFGPLVEKEYRCLVTATFCQK